MNFSTGLIVLGVLIVAVLLVTTVTSTNSTTPGIVAIEFPKKIQADGNEVLGTVKFRDSDGDIARADFEVVKAEAFEPFSFDPQVEGEKQGSFQFAIYTIYPQRVTLEVTLVDREGHRSKPKRFSFVAEMSLGF